MEIIKHLLPSGEFINESTVKRSIVFHHTAGGGTPESVIDNWANDKQGPIGTHYVIGRDGKIVQAIEEDKWAFALGIQNANYRKIEQQSIQIELIAYGYLTTRYDGKIITAYGQIMTKENIYTLLRKWKNFEYFHTYTAEQIKALEWLVPQICERHKIKGSLSMNDFAISDAALACAGGFWTHNSFRADKTDLYPDARILDAFKKGWSDKYSS